MYRLKKGVAEFDVVDGPFAGRGYRRGRLYERIPPGEAHKFEKADVEAAPASEAPAETKGGKKR